MEYLEVDGEYLKKLHGLHSDLPFLPEIIKINKLNKLVSYLYDKKLCCSHKFLKTSIRLWIILKKVHKVLQFNQKAWSKKILT